MVEKGNYRGRRPQTEGGRKNHFQMEKNIQGEPERKKEPIMPPSFQPTSKYQRIGRLPKKAWGRRRGKAILTGDSAAQTLNPARRKKHKIKGV